MKLHFFKYQGTGNDFILVDNRAGNIKLTDPQVAQLCDRRFGIGADGLMLLETVPGHDFKMVYYNADGSESTMCGNGGRCITAFAKMLGIIKTQTNFLAIDGPHSATINTDDTVGLQMQDVSEVKHFDDHCVLNTGSPHYVLWTDDVATADVFHHGRAIRHQPEFEPKGINVNFVQKLGKNSLYVRTYERGVEDETFSCGTGVTAAAIAASDDKAGCFETAIRTPGGALKVSFTRNEDGAVTDVILTGPATFVFEGNIEI